MTDYYQSDDDSSSLDKVRRAIDYVLDAEVYTHELPQVLTEFFKDSFWRFAQPIIEFEVRPMGYGAFQQGGVLLELHATFPYFVLHCNMRMVTGMPVDFVARDIVRELDRVYPVAMERYIKLLDETSQSGSRYREYGSDRDMTPAQWATRQFNRSNPQIINDRDK